YADRTFERTEDRQHLRQLRQCDEHRHVPCSSDRDLGRRMERTFHRRVCDHDERLPERHRLQPLAPRTPYALDHHVGETMRSQSRAPQLVAALALALATFSSAHGQAIDEGLWAPKPALPDFMYHPPPAPGATAPSIRGSSVESMSAKQMQKLQQAAHRPGG